MLLLFFVFLVIILQVNFYCISFILYDRPSCAKSRLRSHLQIEGSQVESEGWSEPSWRDKTARHLSEVSRVRARFTSVSDFNMSNDTFPC